MVPAAMAKQPEHDFAPSWLKIPHSNQITHQSSGDHRLSGGKHQYHSDYEFRSVKCPSTLTMATQDSFIVEGVQHMSMMVPVLYFFEL
ncbi:hypothetical protein BSL78_17928 [Apostichopus japonicus]|uniref:Uncharacterized protein n=1 Tax=Stichopus japonicus TaxID=307972 RepID=A0A2G8KB44_STIJA|nr:hypothetical protein BSL78_17928 [Apostichopus japonicus]